MSVARRLHIRPDATFESTLFLPLNQMAYAAATAVARSPGTAYNPLYPRRCWSREDPFDARRVPIASHPENQTRGLSIVWGKNFSMKLSRPSKLHRRASLNKEVPLCTASHVDDVQFIAGKQKAQEELFHTLTRSTERGDRSSSFPMGPLRRFLNLKTDCARA